MKEIEAYIYRGKMQTNSIKIHVNKIIWLAEVANARGIIQNFRHNLKKTEPRKWELGHY
jgi:hypothetical protein